MESVTNCDGLKIHQMADMFYVSCFTKKIRLINPAGFQVSPPVFMSTHRGTNGFLLSGSKAALDLDVGFFFYIVQTSAVSQKTRLQTLKQQTLLDVPGRREGLKGGR